MVSDHDNKIMNLFKVSSDKETFYIENLLNSQKKAININEPSDKNFNDVVEWLVECVSQIKEKQKKLSVVMEPEDWNEIELGVKPMHRELLEGFKGALIKELNEIFMQINLL